MYNINMFVTNIRYKLFLLSPTVLKLCIQ